MNLIAIGLIAFSMPHRAQREKPKIDVPGITLMIGATATLILGFSSLGTPNRFGVGLLQIGISLAAWIAFVQIEKRAKSPILDPQILFNRTFMTAALAGLLSFFAIVAITAYSPIFVQHVMAVSPTVSGSIMIPYSTLVTFLGVLVGFLLVRRWNYRWMYFFGYGVVTLAMLAMWRFTANTPILVFMLITGAAGIGLGVLPTINVVVSQFAVPKELLGVATGAIFFFQLIGMAISPAILGFAQRSLPNLESGLKLVFLVASVALGVTFLLILTIPEISLHANAED